MSSHDLEHIVGATLLITGLAFTAWVAAPIAIGIARHIGATRRTRRMR